MHLRAFAPYALPFLALAVMSATIWRTWTFRLSAVPLALIGIVGATQGPRYDVIVAPSGDLAAVRDADGALEVVGKRFNAFAAEQWLTADGDGRDAAQARAFDAPCDRLGCVAALPEGELLSIVLDRLAFDEDCARAEVVVSTLSAPSSCKAKFLFDEQALARLGAVGLTWSDASRWRATAARSRTVPGRPRRSPRATTGSCAPGIAAHTAPTRRMRRTSRRRGVSGSAATADSDQVDPFLSIIAVPRGSGPGWPGDPGTSGSSRE